MPFPALATVLPIIGKGVIVATKVCNVIEAGYEIHTIINNDEFTTNEKAHRVATSALFLTAQTLDVGVDLAGNISSTARVGIRIGVGITDITRKISQKAVQDECDSSDGLDIAATAAFRIADAGSLAADLYPKQLGHLDGAVDSLQAIAILVSNRQSLVSAGTSTGNLFFGRSRPDTNSPSSISIGDKYKAEILEVLNASDITEFNTIPQYFLQDPVLSQWICPITKKPIRHISVIETTIESSTPSWYEKSAITAWISDNHRELGKVWPKRITVRKRKLVDYTLVQQQIDKRLQVLLNEAHEMNTRGEFSYLDET